MTLKQIFINNLKELRKKEGLSQMKLAEYCNVSLGYIGEIESGRKFPSTELIEKISYVLRIEPYLFFKAPKNNIFFAYNTNQLPSLPYNLKKQLKVKIKNQLKTQIKTQITSQINLSMTEILNEIYEVLDNN